MYAVLTTSARSGAVLREGIGNWPRRGAGTRLMAARRPSAVGHEQLVGGFGQRLTLPGQGLGRLPPSFYKYPALTAGNVYPPLGAA